MLRGKELPDGRGLSRLSQHWAVLFVIWSSPLGGLLKVAQAAYGVVLVCSANHLHLVEGTSEGRPGKPKAAPVLGWKLMDVPLSPGPTSWCRRLLGSTPYTRL